MLRWNRRQAAVACLAGAALVVAGCSSSSPPSSESASPPPTGATLPGPASIALSEMPSGNATLTWDSNTSLVTVQVQAHGFTPGSSHAMHIHPGTCADQSGPPSIPFPDLTAGAGGNVLQTAVSGKVPAGIPPHSYLNIHLAPNAQLGSPTDVSFTPIACADIPSGTPAAGPVVVHLQVPPQHGNSPNGTANIGYDAATHTVHAEVRASGLPPNSAHAAHIHAGSCDAQGPVVYSLPDLQSDDMGNATSTTTIDDVQSAPPAAGWYVNVHMGSSSQIMGNDNSPTLLFAPILCGDVRAGG
ncbi:CHRD domain-containing protein [Rhodococcus spelaei]|uniref:CHRD domain-containing protein n=1 Tax=Rhodococcus spelaei TaxID=2546320 RepID=A0A541AZI5_9NOCA|nr:CHRD domain-containing protein [Rhodococcus spelaei]TQF65473.1 CHRD domain-containing protein [Rhodococcus spelaei]